MGQEGELIDGALPCDIHKGRNSLSSPKVIKKVSSLNKYLQTNANKVKKIKRICLNQGTHYHNKIHNCGGTFCDVGLGCLLLYWA